ncbi:MAG TPA: translational GTPase TypA [Planctomycetota bacterium]|nr:translational GTPase TypA [Planctomycetota bacterium]
MPPSPPAVSTQSLRNVAIIAHVDHGKTTMVDKLLSATGAIPLYQQEQLGECILDSNDLERERGITILAKNISIYFKGTKINLIDTPGHADFGGEVERVLRMSDGVLLLVDAAEGPMPQTRFVLRKAFDRRLRPIVVVNKIDRPDARIAEVLDEIGELFLELAMELGLEDAADHILDFPVLYASGKQGFAKRKLDDPSESVVPLLDAILEHIPEPKGSLEGSLQLQIASLDYSDYIGRIGIGRVHRGSIRVGDRVLVCGKPGQRQWVVKELFLFDKLRRVPAVQVDVGDICAIAGIADVTIGDTLTDIETPDPLPITEVDRPTISMVFRVNDSPFAGLDGKFVTSRHLRDRLYKELESNVALRVEETAEAAAFEVSGRGTLHLGVLIENMRRQGYEFQVGKPRVIYMEEDGVRMEPIERMLVQAPQETAGRVIEVLGARRGEMLKYEPQGERILMEFKVPSRGLIGIGSRLMTLTAGEALIYHSFEGYEAFKGAVPERGVGVMVSIEQGAASGYALFGLKDRGPTFVEPGTKVYEGMIVGEHCKNDDISVNVCREKKLTNMRAAGSDENIILKPPRRMSIEEALEYIEEDELLEVTPVTYRLRKKVLNEKARRRENRSGE